MTALQDLLAWTAAGIGLAGFAALAMGLAWRVCAPGRGRTADGGAGRFAKRGATLSALAVVMAATAVAIG
jgi:hypothetical protein